MTPAPAPDPRPPASPETTIGGRDLTQWRTRAGRRLLAVLAAALDRLGPLERWGRSNLALVVTVVVGGVVVLGVDLLAAQVYDAVTENEDLAVFDRPVLDAAVALRSPARDAAVTAFTDLGGTAGMPVLVLVVTVLLVLLRRSWSPVGVMAVAAAGSLAMTVLGKDLVGRARPPVTLAVPPLETSPSFPSGHTLNATVLVGAAAYLLLVASTRAWQRTLVVVVAVAFILAMGLSRVYLGHHWLTDVVAGWLLGLGWLAIVVTGDRVRLTLRHGRSAAAPATGAGVAAAPEGRAGSGR
ncbi:phosphatase PAP2 family protein [Phycicoccus duodecadis]|uniref:Undecaprenyl-diphosphatase n=1 Tax=Phycicoccus duodecadis TaxID=173053 RepID=A0A2N3YJT7_9MICO|nr:phosphatase PAP2 family protein [Phycicoccus duodecadis]PKW27116.1 undecaprenyl-diphosphatase [Phycicoccus duodecadis]